MAPLKTHKQLRQELTASGDSVRDLAAKIGRPSQYHLVYAVVTGRNKGLRGESHNIAVQLGLKTGSLKEAA